MASEITIHQLAQAMSKSPRELLFELQSIGVQVKGIDDVLPREVVEKLLSGAPLQAPNQVIIRDGKSKRKPSKKTLKKRIPKVSIETHKDIPTIDIPKKVEKPKPETESAKKETAPKAEPPKTKKSAGKEAEKKRPAPVKKSASGATASQSTTEKSGRPSPGKQTVKKPSTLTKDTKKPVRKRVDRKKAKPATSPNNGVRFDVRKFVGTSAEAARKLQEAEEMRALLKKRKKRKGGEDHIPHVPLTLDQQVARLKELIPADKAITIPEGCTLRNVIDKLDVKVKDFMPYLFQKGITLSPNQPVSQEFLTTLSDELHFTFSTQTFEEKEDKKVKEEKNEGAERAPVVTIMGHVDHGKTSILDAIRKSRVASNESGGITQHMGAYKVEIDKGTIVFIDTPGHEAFTQMRSRGAHVTDIVILVVAADDGIMPQTVEAINHIKAAGVSMIVAINKIDKANADPEKVKKQLADRDLLVEDWGGEVVAVPVSAVTEEGIDSLLEMILIMAEMLELRADPARPARGPVLETRKEAGRGIVATVLIQEGTMKPKDTFICGDTNGKVRAMYDEHGKTFKKAPPATPVDVVGFNDLPKPGDMLHVVANEKEARRIVELRRQSNREDAAKKSPVSLEELFASVGGGSKAVLKFILKADVRGTLEVAKNLIVNSATDDVEILILHEGAGTISANDVSLALASNAMIIGFNVKPERNAAKEAERQGVEIRLYSVIYDLIEDIQTLVEGNTERKIHEVVLGSAKVLKVFKIPKVGVILGCKVSDGLIKRGAQMRLVRDDTVIRTGHIATVKRFTEDVNEVKKGFECGLGLDRAKDVQEGDIIECFERREEES